MPRFGGPALFFHASASMAKKEKHSNAAALGRKGGEARTRTMTPEQRKKIARKAIAARWAKAKTIKKDK